MRKAIATALLLILPALAMAEADFPRVSGPTAPEPAEEQQTLMAEANEESVIDLQLIHPGEGE